MASWLATTACLAAKPPATVPADAAKVLDRLPRGYAALEPSAGANAAKPPIAQIQALLNTAARSGDSRLAARAEALLARYPARTRSLEVLHARAFAAQHRHDFDAARGLLEKILALEPRDGGARLSMAQILLVQGEPDRARGECTTTLLTVDPELGQLCVAAWSLRTGDYANAATVLDRWLGDAKPDPDTLLYALTMRAEIASRAKAPDADDWFRKALALAPDDVLTLAAYARHLRANQRDREAYDLLADAPDTDGLRLQQALAAHALGLPDAAALAAAQGRRYALAHEVGTQPEMRDEAEYLLTLRGDADAALALAQRNFASQRDVEDVSILQRAAAAAQRPDALAAYDAWHRRFRWATTAPAEATP